MKTRVVFIALYLTLASPILFGQSVLQNKVDYLESITNMPYICEGSIGSPGCGQIAFWNAVTEKLAIVPYLLDKLDDTTMTSATVPNWGYNYTVADIAYSAIQEIIKDIPTFELLGVDFDSNGCGYCAYWKHLSKDIRNRRSFRSNLIEWYAIHKDNLIWVEDKRTLTCDCRFDHPNGGYYELRE